MSIMKNCNRLWFKDIFETIIINCDFKENFKNNFKIIILVCRNNFKTIIINYDFKKNYKNTVYDWSFKDICVKLFRNHIY